MVFILINVFPAFKALRAHSFSRETVLISKNIRVPSTPDHPTPTSKSRLWKNYFKERFTFSSAFPSFFFFFFFFLLIPSAFLFFFFFFPLLFPSSSQKLLSPPQPCACQKVSRLRVCVAFLKNLLLSDPGRAGAGGFAKKSPFRK